MDRIKEIIAIVLFKIGFKPSATHFIDEVTIMYGYGKCHDVGVFEYNLPAKYIKKSKWRDVAAGNYAWTVSIKIEAYKYAET